MSGWKMLSNSSASLVSQALVSLSTISLTSEAASSFMLFPSFARDVHAS